MSLGSWIGLVTAGGLLAYLVYTLIRPGKF